MTDSGNELVNSIAFMHSNGASFEFEGPFEFVRDGGFFEVSIPTDPNDYAGIHNETAERYTDKVGDIFVALSDGGIEASGEIEAADITEDKLIVRVDDPDRIDPSEIGRGDLDL